VSAAETTLPWLTFEAAWLQEPLFDVPARQNAFCVLLWLIPEVAPELPPPPPSDADTALPVLTFEAAWLQELVFDVPAIQIALWVLLWLIPEVELLPPFGSDADAPESALPLLTFEAAWLQELVLVVPATQRLDWSLVCDMNEEAELLLPVGVPPTDTAKTAFDVVARTRNPASIIVASIESTFVVLMS
jgi:hypothetical protein